jgi:hypothetical protein
VKNKKNRLRVGGMHHHFAGQKKEIKLLVKFIIFPPVLSSFINNNPIAQ